MCVYTYIHAHTHVHTHTHTVTRELTTEPHVLALKPMMLFGCCPQPPCVIFLKAMLPVFSTPFLYLPWKISFLTVFSALISGSYFEERLIIYKCKAGYLCHLVASHLTQNKNQCPSSDRQCYMESDLCHLSDPVSCSSIQCHAGHLVTSWTCQALIPGFPARELKNSVVRALGSGLRLSGFSTGSISLPVRSHS